DATASSRGIARGLEQGSRAREGLGVRLRGVSRNSTELADQAIERGHALEDAGHFASALDCYLEALRCSPEYPRAHLNAGNALRLLRRHADAEAAFREAIRRDPEYAEAHFN